MTDHVDVVEVNPIVFVKSITEQIANGYYVQNSIVGYPHMALPYQIRLFETDEPAIKNKMEDSIHTVVVEGYDIMNWLLDVQDMAIQGFKMDLTRATVDDYKSITMTKPAPVQFDLGTPVEKPTAPAKPKRTTKPKPTQGE